MSTGDFWDDVQGALGFEVSAGVYDELSGELLEPPQVIEPLAAALRQPRRLGKHVCPHCGGHVRRWYASSDGDGDVEPRAQCESCEWGF